MIFISLNTGFGSKYLKRFVSSDIPKCHVFKSPLLIGTCLGFQPLGWLAKPALV